MKLRKSMQALKGKLALNVLKPLPKKQYEPDKGPKPIFGPLPLVPNVKRAQDASVYTIDDKYALGYIYDAYHHSTVLDIWSGRRLLHAADVDYSGLSRVSFATISDLCDLIRSYDYIDVEDNDPDSSDILPPAPLYSGSRNVSTSSLCSNACTIALLVTSPTENGIVSESSLSSMYSQDSFDDVRLDSDLLTVDSAHWTFEDLLPADSPNDDVSLFGIEKDDSSDYSPTLTVLDCILEEDEEEEESEENIAQFESISVLESAGDDDDLATLLDECLTDLKSPPLSPLAKAVPHSTGLLDCFFDLHSVTFEFPLADVTYELDPTLSEDVEAGSLSNGFLFSSIEDVTEIEAEGVVFELAVFKDSLTDTASVITPGPLLPTFTEENFLPTTLSKGLEPSISLQSFSGDVPPSGELDGPHLTGLKDILVDETLGEGGGGLVTKVHIRSRQQSSALKAIKKWSDKNYKVEEIAMNELRAMKMVLGDKMFVQLEAGFHDTKFFYLLMEYYPGGDLADELDRSGNFSFDKAQFYAAELLLGIGKLHSLGIVHRDLKPANVLLSSDGHIAISDFGLCRIIDIDAQAAQENVEEIYDVDKLKVLSKKRITCSVCGTSEYMAPEVFTYSGYSFAADMYSYGVVVYEMVTGRLPFRGKTAANIFEAVLDHEITYEDEDQVGHSTETFLDIMLSLYPKERMTADSARFTTFFDGINWDKMEDREVVPPALTLALRRTSGTTNSKPYEAVDFYGSDGSFVEGEDPFPEFTFLAPSVTAPQ